MRLPLEALACALLAAACSNNKPPETAESAAATTSYTAATPADPASPDVTRTSSDDVARTETSSTGTDEAAAKRRAAANPAPATSGSTDTDTTRPTATSAEPTATPPGTPPDNTKVNERDRKSSAVTPIDQGENPTDLKLTQQIRQAVMADSSLSLTAKNVKIITLNKKVTLRGPVKTAAERSSIEAAARKVAGAGMVDNQLEVTQ